MQFKTHIAFSFLVAIFSIDFLKIKNQILFVIVLLFFSILPDLDEYSSKVSKKLRPFSYITNLLFSHRGILHSIFMPLALFLVLFSISQRIIGTAVLIGYMSHLILDALTIKGVRPLFPLINKSIKGFVKVNSILDTLLFYVLLISIVYTLI